MFLFTDPGANASHGYVADRWVAPDLFEYCGEGQSGNQEIRRYNRSIADHVHVGKTLRLFSGWRGLVTYEGQFQLDAREPYYFAYGRGRDGQERRVVIFRLRPIGFQASLETAPPTPEAWETDEGLTVDQAPAQGTAYKPADEQVSTKSERLPFTVDPNEQDRASQAPRRRKMCWRNG